MKLIYHLLKTMTIYIGVYHKSFDFVHRYFIEVREGKGKQNNAILGNIIVHTTTTFSYKISYKPVV